MKLPKNYFENLTASKYRAYLKLLPNMRKESNKAIVMLIFTFIALSFLGFFAINPTLTTIVELKKQLEDSQFVHDQLTTKMANLSSLQQQYEILTPDLHIIIDAIPQNPQVAVLAGQLEALAPKYGVQIKSIRIEKVVLATTKKTKLPPATSFLFTMDAVGEYDAMMDFASAITNFNRIVTITGITLTKDVNSNDLLLTIEGKQYFQK